MVAKLVPVADITDRADGKVLVWNAASSAHVYEERATSTAGYDEGTSFPGSPISGDKFYRTDLNYLCVYDGTRWLTVNEYTLTMWGLAVITSVQVGQASLPDASLQFWADRVVFTYRVATTNDGTHYWDISVYKYDSAASPTALATKVTNSGVSPDTGYITEVAVGAAVNPASTVYLGLTPIKTSSPGALGVSAAVIGRLIIT